METTLIDDAPLMGRHMQLFNHNGRQIRPLTPGPTPVLQTDESLTVCRAVTPEHLTQVRNLMRAFLQWLRIRYQGSPWFIDGYFNGQAFESELTSLPGEYAPPAGRLLLAGYHGHPAGCVTFRPLGEKTCEMKRMYVNPDFQGRGVGRTLVGTLIAEAKKIGYKSMLLDTGCKQIEARNLYRSLGFREIEPYYEVARKQKDMLVFMELRLQ